MTKPTSTYVIVDRLIDICSAEFEDVNNDIRYIDGIENDTIDLSSHIEEIEKALSAISEKISYENSVLSSISSEITGKLTAYFKKCDIESLSTSISSIISTYFKDDETIVFDYTDLSTQVIDALSSKFNQKWLSVKVPSLTGDVNAIFTISTYSVSDTFVNAISSYPDVNAFMLYDISGNIVANPESGIFDNNLSGYTLSLSGIQNNAIYRYNWLLSSNEGIEYSTMSGLGRFDAIQQYSNTSKINESFKDKLDEIIEDFVTLDMLNDYEPSASIIGYANRSVTGDLTTTDMLNDYVTSAEMTNYILTSSLTGYATTGYVSSYISGLIEDAKTITIETSDTAYSWNSLTGIQNIDNVIYKVDFDSFPSTNVIRYDTTRVATSAGFTLSGIHTSHDDVVNVIEVHIPISANISGTNVIFDSISAVAEDMPDTYAAYENIDIHEDNKVKRIEYLTYLVFECMRKDDNETIRYVYRYNVEKDIYEIVNPAELGMFSITSLEDGNVITINKMLNQRKWFYEIY